MANAQGITLQLTPSLYNETSNTQCFGTATGSVSLQVSGGTPPYTYVWTNNATTQNITNLAAGYYGVQVTDANNNTKTADITLIDPPVLHLNINVHKYPNGQNISCYSCYNGSLTTEVTGGVFPYEYVWLDDATVNTSYRENLGKGSYHVIVIDYNGCLIEAVSEYITEPDRSDWAMNGNAGTDPTENFIGNFDAVDLSFRTNNTEALRIKANGQIKFPSLAGAEDAIVFVDSDGNLSRFTGFGNPLVNTPWNIFGNSLTQPQNSFLGTVNQTDLNFRTNNLPRMIIKDDGNVGIGTTSPNYKMEIQYTGSANGIKLNNSGGTGGNSEIRFDYGSEQHWAIGSRLQTAPDVKKHFFIWNHLLSECDFVIDQVTGKVGIGCDPPAFDPNNITPFRLYVEGGIMTRELKVTIGTFADDVFDKDYHLPSLTALSSYIDLHRHLPGIPTEKEVMANGGFDVGKMQVDLLRKVEELTLYILQQQKTIEALNFRITSLEAKN